MSFFFLLRIHSSRGGCYVFKMWSSKKTTTYALLRVFNKITQRGTFDQRLKEASEIRERPREMAMNDDVVNREERRRRRIVERGSDRMALITGRLQSLVPSTPPPSPISSSSFPYYNHMSCGTFYFMRLNSYYV